VKSITNFVIFGEEVGRGQRCYVLCICVATCCIVLQCVAVCCSVLKFDGVSLCLCVFVFIMQADIGMH